MRTEYRDIGFIIDISADGRQLKLRNKYTRVPKVRMVVKYRRPIEDPEELVMKILEQLFSDAELPAHVVRRAVSPSPAAPIEPVEEDETEDDEEEEEYDGYDDMTVKALREELRDRALAVGGLKLELIERLRDNEYGV